MENALPLSLVEALTGSHRVSEFDCGQHVSLSLWLQRHALQSQSSDSARTYVVHRGGRVAAYYAIAAGSVARSDATLRAAQGQPNYPIPVALLGRLAVDQREQGTGLGRALLKDALIRIEGAANILGIRAVLVHAIDPAAAAFYQRFDFDPCPGDDLHLMLLMKDLRKNLRP